MFISKTHTAGERKQLVRFCCQYSKHSPVYRVTRSAQDPTILQEDFHQLELWEDKWQMQFNADKCEVIQITKKRNPITENYTIHGQQLQIVNNAKYLGATLRSDLPWNQHVNITVKKATNSSIFLWRNIRDCPARMEYISKAQTAGYGCDVIPNIAMNWLLSRLRRSWSQPQ